MLLTNEKLDDLLNQPLLLWSPADYRDVIDQARKALVLQDAPQETDGPEEWEAKAMLRAATVVDVDFPGESHCDQCDLQGVCDYLHDQYTPGRECKAYPRVYRLPGGYNQETES